MCVKCFEDTFYTSHKICRLCGVEKGVKTQTAKERVKNKLLHNEMLIPLFTAVNDQNWLILVGTSDHYSPFSQWYIISFNSKICWQTNSIVWHSRKQIWGRLDTSLTTDNWDVPTITYHPSWNTKHSRDVLAITYHWDWSSVLRLRTINNIP